MATHTKAKSRVIRPERRRSPVKELIAMEISPIRTDADFAAAPAKVAALVMDDPRPGTPDGDRLDVLATQIKSYEAYPHSVPAPNPIKDTQLAME